MLIYIIVKRQFTGNNPMLFIVSKSDEELRKRNKVQLFETLKRKEIGALEDVKHSCLSTQVETNYTQVH